MKEKLIFLSLISFQITFLTIVYFVIFKQDSTVLALAISILAGLAGYIFGRKQK